MSWAKRLRSVRAAVDAIEVEVKATCLVPFHRLEIVLNGQTVASHDEPSGASTRCGR